MANVEIFVILVLHFLSFDILHLDRVHMLKIYDFIRHYCVFLSLRINRKNCQNKTDNWEVGLQPYYSDTFSNHYYFDVTTTCLYFHFYLIFLMVHCLVGGSYYHSLHVHAAQDFIKLFLHLTWKCQFQSWLLTFLKIVLILICKEYFEYCSAN